MRRAFTLIELLVSISIIALLIAILLPALAKSRDHTKLVLCLTHIRGMSQGVLIYTNDFDGSYPDWAWGRAQPNMIAEQERSGFGTSGPGDYDFRDVFREYFGSKLQDFMVCPMSPDSWLEPVKNSRKDIDNYNMGAASNTKTTYLFYFGKRATNLSGSFIDYSWRRLKTMETVDEVWTPNWGDLEFDLLLSDTLHRNGWSGSFTVASHKPLGGSAVDGATRTGSYVGWEMPVSSSVTANFARTDGSAETYLTDYDAIAGDDWVGYKSATTGENMLPRDCAR